MSAAATDGIRREKINVPSPEHIEIALDLYGPHLVSFLHLYVTHSSGVCTSTLRYSRDTFAVKRVVHLSDGELMSMVVHAVAVAMARDGYELVHFSSEKERWRLLTFMRELEETTVVFLFRKI